MPRSQEDTGSGQTVHYERWIEDRPREVRAHPDAGYTDKLRLDGSPRGIQVLDWDSVNALERWNGTKWQHPPSHLIRADLHDLLADLTVDGATKRLFHDLEYRHALLVARLPDGSHPPLTGEYRGDRHFGESTLTGTGQRFRAAAARAGTSWPWWSVVGDDLESTLTELEKSVSWNQ